MAGSEYHLAITPYNASSNAPQLLADASGLSQQAIKDAMNKGAVWLTHQGHTRRLRRHKGKLKAGDQLHLYHDPQLLAQQPAQARLLADEGDYSVWFKPHGMLSQGSKWSDHTTLTRWSEQHLQPQRPAFLVHRLDRAASGLMLIAHSKSMARHLAALFEQRTVDKRYLVIVEGKFPLKPADKVLDAPIDGRPALSIARRLAFDPGRNRSLLEIRIETGRKHQIRRHLADIGFPVVGDRLHGSSQQRVDLQLAAVSLQFDWPETGRDFFIEAPLAPELGSLLDELRKHDG